jgi:hypothetical protein
MDEYELRKIKALEDAVDYLRRIDGMLQVMAATLERIENEVGP